MQSELERQVFQRIVFWRMSLRAHDRAVLLGFFLSLFPLFPVAMFGLVIGLLNRRLHRAGKIDVSEGGFIRRGLILGGVNSVLGLLLLLLLVRMFFAINWLGGLESVAEYIYIVAHWVRDQILAVRGGVLA